MSEKPTNNKKTSPIGVFDSGVGGMSVLKELYTLMPEESFIYYADNGNCPFGPKPKEEVIQLCIRITEFMLHEHHCKMIIVACNTATAAAISHLRANYNLLFIGMEPAVKPATLSTKSGHIGILATYGTFIGDLFKETSRRFGKDAILHLQVGNGLVRAVEKDLIYTKETREILESYLLPWISCGVDQVVLGCTHYPFLIPVIRDIVGKDVNIINPAPAIAIHAKRQLERYGLKNEIKDSPIIQFFASGEKETLKKMALKLFNDKFVIN